MYNIRIVLMQNPKISIYLFCFIFYFWQNWLASTSYHMMPNQIRLLHWMQSVNKRLSSPWFVGTRLENIGNIPQDESILRVFLFFFFFVLEVSAPLPSLSAFHHQQHRGIQVKAQLC